MKSKQPRNGIVAGGNFSIDQIKIIDRPLKENELIHIEEKFTSTGGSPYNILKNLSLLKAPFKLAGIGLVGDDDNGLMVLDDCIKNDIDKKGIRITRKDVTSFTDVITNPTNGKRTLMHYPGANNHLQISDFRLDKYNYKIFHLGYLALLGNLDLRDEQQRTRASYIFENAKQKGFKTSANLVHTDSHILKAIIFPSLPYIDYLFLNKKELVTLTHAINDITEMVEACKKLLQKGISEWVIVFTETNVIAVNSKYNYFIHPKFNVPKTQIKGKAGEKEALIAGILWGFHESLSIEESMKISVAVAAACLRDASCTKGILPFEKTLKFANSFDYFEE